MLPESATILLPFALGTSAISGALLLPHLLQGVLRLFRSVHARSRIMGAPEGGNIFIADFCRNGVAPLSKPARLLLRVKGVCSACACVVKALALRAYSAQPQAVCESLILLALCVFALALLLTRIIPVALCTALCAVMFLVGKAQKQLTAWEQRLLDQIPDALRSLGICFGAGYSLQQALEQTAGDTEDPLGAELRQASFDVSAGRSLDEALSLLERRTHVSDLRFAIVALEIQHRTGGSLKELLDNTASAVLASADLKRQLSVQTAQARMSAKIVTLLPLVLVVLLSLMMEGYLQAFFSSAAGLMVLGIAITLEVTGVLIIRKILGIDFD
ncbi:MAG: type II secretion system F family protein [Coriobacteriales bacterium]|nr:type II secretion system F family protein [Coriobacteriales bacterium]